MVKEAVQDRSMSLTQNFIRQLHKVLLRDKPFVTFSEMAEQLSVNRSAVQKQIEEFRKKGYLDRRDDGSWHVLALNSRVE